MYVAGIDEVGRGPLAGPVSIGVAWCKEDVDLMKLFPFLNDSKKVTEKRRGEIYEAVKKCDDISFVVVSSSNKVIDEKGISFAIEDAIERGCKDLPEDIFVYLDGRLSAPEKFKQKSVIGGDGSVPIISLASIVAKVERDRYMEKIGEDYPEYGLGKHKGYGTKVHREAIVEFGLSEIHRESFCKNLTK